MIADAQLSTANLVRLAPEEWVARAVRLGMTATLFASKTGGVHVTIGEGERWDADGPSALEQIGQGWRSWAHRARPESSQKALTVGGFGFDPLRPPSDEWASLPAALWMVPNFVLRWNDRQSLPSVYGASGDSAARNDLARLASLPDVSGACDEFTLDPDRPGEHRDFIDRVARARQAITEKRFAKVVLARAAHAQASPVWDVASILRRLRRKAGNAAVFAVCRGGSVFLGATPELLVRTRGGIVETLALAGSTARGASKLDDQRLAAALEHSAKERQEHAYVRQAILRSLGPIASHVWAEPDPNVLRLGTVQHLATPIRGQLRSGQDLWSAAAALHPTPAVAGEPREAALSYLRETEPLSRGWYTGAVGFIDPNGDGELWVALRCAMIVQGRAVLYAGCGVVEGSDPEREAAECELKLRTIREVIAGD